MEAIQHAEDLTFRVTGSQMHARNAMECARKGKLKTLYIPRHLAHALYIPTDAYFAGGSWIGSLALMMDQLPP